VRGEECNVEFRVFQQSAMSYLRGFLIILAFLGAGIFIADLSGVPIPGSVVGMLMLVVALRIGVVRIEWVRPMAELLLRHMALFFVPPGVAIMLYFDLVVAEWIPIVIAGAVSTIAVMITVGLLHQKLEVDD
jgi:holin-like protein